MSEIVWDSQKDSIVVSPEKGGRIVSWKHLGKGLIYPLKKINGGILRILSADERFPGSSYAVPHAITHQRQFSISMKYFWNTAGAFARLFGWKQKANLLYIDGLLLEKKISFLPEKSAVVLDMKISNVSKTKKILVPWIHNDFNGIFDNAYMVQNGGLCAGMTFDNISGWFRRFFDV